MHLPPAGAGGNLVAGDGLGQEHRGLQVDPVDLVIRFLGDLQQRLLALDSNAVHQHVDASVALRDTVHRVPYRGDGLHVQGDAVRRESVPGQSACEPPRLLGMPSRHGDVRAGQRQRPGDGLADAAVSARHEHDLVAHVEDVRQRGGCIDGRGDWIHG